MINNKILENFKIYVSFADDSQLSDWLYRVNDEWSIGFSNRCSLKTIYRYFMYIERFDIELEAKNFQDLWS